ncbi:MAG: acetylglutamate kinase [Myxococcales bacterium]|nr:acetylglutamate kinase [Myxococcales bacterium]MCB9581043.1 acetylglutamate kinase [Polyangiaceae bacterium]
MSATVTRVVKLGGEVIRGARLGEVAKQIAALDVGSSEVDARVVVVHGGGPQTSALQKALGQTPNIVGGRRITDDAALEAIKMAVAGVANVDLCAALLAAGVRPIGLHGGSSAVIRAVQRPPRVVSGAGPDPIHMGHVGDVVGFERDLLEELLSLGYVPVLACLGADAAGRIYNINADIVATRLAVALGAADLFLLMDAPGVLRDKNDPATRIERLKIAEAQALIAEGVVDGGMIPKLEESFEALRGGVARVHLLSDALPSAAEAPGTVGTLLTL